MKKVLQLEKNSGYSGAENVVINICLLVKAVESIYVSKSGEIDHILEEKKIRQIKLHEFNLFEIIKCVKRERPDIIHAHDITASIYGAWLRVFFPKIKVISHIHNDDPRMSHFSLRWLLYTMCIPFFFSIFVVSEAVKENYFCNLLKKAKVLSNIVNINPTKKNEDKVYDLISVARLVPQKDPARFLKIVQEIKKIKSNISVAYIGDGVLREWFLKEIERNNLTDNITYLGFKDNPYRFMEQSKIFILTSKYEGFGLVALEAITLGLPVVATNVGGLKYIIDDTVGLLSNNDKKMIEEVIELLNNREYFLKKKKATVSKSKQVNDIDTFIKVLKDTYRGVR